ncbi:MAG TPA: CDP-glycerol glycerophosphotransferase family protein [Candidatus Limnocylindria bacterium]|nr:CDP-glycerol glycerophosphotransferase family protein [Candidatus Limnocylindria bacterium]
MTEDMPRAITAPIKELQGEGGGARRMVISFVRRTGGAGIYYLSRLSRRDRRVWVFGNHKGFRDNPRYLAEHIVHAHPELQPWWIARTPGEAKMAREAGLRVTMFASREAARIQRHAGVAFLSNAFIDLRAPYLGGALIVHLYHGTALKRVLLDMDVTRVMRESLATRAFKRFHRWSIARRLRQVDLIMAAGELARERFVTAFGIPAERIPPVGTPRFDVIQGGAAYDRVVHGDLRAQLGVKPNEHLVLWLPTWREHGDAAWLPPLDAATVDEAFGGTNVVMLVKTHPYADHEVYGERLPQHPKVRLLPEADVDVNTLLRIADTLVTDYSSAFFDYALLERPIHFFAPDTGEYRGGRGLYEPFENLTGDQHHTEWRSLLLALADASRGEDEQGMAMMRRVVAMARNNTEPGSCERIVQTVARAAGVTLAPAVEET